MRLHLTVSLRVAVGIAAVLVLGMPSANCAADVQAPDTVAQQIIAATGFAGGLVVHIGCGDGKVTAALRANSSCLVQGLDADPGNVAKARAYITGLGCYGPVSVVPWQGGRLPYSDGVVNLLVNDVPTQVGDEEILRVLAPGGVTCTRTGDAWRKTVKPRPAGIDDWPHALYGADNNAVSNDVITAPPYRVQWIAAPHNARHHETLGTVTVVVSAGNRLFYIIDESPTASILFPPTWSVLARDAFSGVQLWKRTIDTWENHMRGFRSGPPELARRLVATKDHVFVTLGLNAPVFKLDAVTGETLMTYAGTEGTDEIALLEKTLFLVVENPVLPENQAAPAFANRHVVAVDVESGKVLWSNPDAHALPTTLAVDGKRAAFVDASAVVCLDAKTGKELWRTPRAVVAKRPGNSAPTLVLHDDVALVADRSDKAGDRTDPVSGQPIAQWLATEGPVGELNAYSADTGTPLWSCPCAETYHAPVDVFVVDGLVWVGQSLSRTGPDFVAGRDLHTGEIKRKLNTDAAWKTTMPHHRCHRNRATCRFIVAGRTGVEFIDLLTGQGYRHHWVRGVCQYGTIPANGLLYAPPHSCACYIEAKLTGFLALSPEHRSGTPTGAGASARLERGPAYDAATPGPNTALDQGSASDWPTYRHDAARTGAASTNLPSSDLHVLWDLELGKTITSPVIAGGRLFVADTDTHTVKAVDAARGTVSWQFTADGRVDSPPTVQGDRVVFGANDGWVYCVSAGDGRLAWRFNAAPQDQQFVVEEQLESPWPVHGSVLVEDNTVTFAAGRSSYIDDGLFLFRLDLATGRVLATQRLYDRSPDTGDQPEEPIMFEMPGAMPDVLSHDGTLLYMRRLAFDPASLESRKSGPHLYSPAGFLNGDWWHRTYWIYGDHFYSGYIGWYFAGRENPAGRLLVVDGDTVYGYSYKPRFYKGATGREYQLVAAGKNAGHPIDPPDYKTANRDYPHSGPGKFKIEYQWSADIPFLGRAMLTANDRIFVAGPPEKALTSRPAFEGEKGGFLGAVSKADGTLSNVYKLESPPVFDGLAAAGEHLYLSAVNGHVLCLGAADPARGSSPLPVAAALAAKKRQPVAPTAPGLVGHWRLDEGEGGVARDSSATQHDADAAGRWVKGDFGICLQAKGLPNALSIPDGPALHVGAGSFSFDFWIAVDADDARLMGREDNFPERWWTVNLLADGRLELVLGQGQGQGESVRPTSKGRLPLKQWNHVAFVVDREQRKVTWYLNGAPDASTELPPTLTADFDILGVPLHIPSAHKPFSGLFDELRIHTRALTDREIQARYDAEKPRRTSPDHEDLTEE